MPQKHIIDDTEAFENQFTAAKVRKRVAQHPELYRGVDIEKLIRRLESEEATAATRHLQRGRLHSGGDHMIDFKDVTAANKAYDEKFGNLDEVQVPEAMQNLDAYVDLLTGAVRSGKKITRDQLEAKFGEINWGL